MREAEVLDDDGHAAGVGVGDLDVCIHNSAVAGKTHGAKTGRVTQPQQLIFERGDVLVGVAVSDQA